MVKFKLMFNKDEETVYLNQMADTGYAMTGFCAGFYTFDKCQPGAYHYQVDISEGFFRVSNDYREFMQEMNVEIVCIWGMWVILRKKAADGPFVLYTDLESTIEYYEKIKKMFKIATILEIICIMIEGVCAIRGTDWASIMVPLACVSLLAAFVVVFCREIARVNRILRELRERIGKEEPGGSRGQGMPSRFLALGLVLNGLGYLIPQAEEIGWMHALYGSARGTLHGLGLLLMGVGIGRTIWKCRE